MNQRKDKPYLSLHKKKQINITMKSVKKKKKCSAVATKIRTAHVPHGESALTTLSSRDRRGEGLNHLRTYSRIKYFVQSHVSLLTEQNDLAIFDYSTKNWKTCNVKRVGRLE